MLINFFKPKDYPVATAGEIIILLLCDIQKLPGGCRCCIKCIWLLPNGTILSKGI